MTKRVLAAVLAVGILAAAGCGREPLSREDAAPIFQESSAAGILVVIPPRVCRLLPRAEQR